jgi:hypothetical protein
MACGSWSAVLPVALAMSLLGTPSAQAKDISYTYLDGTYQFIDPDLGSSDTGYRLEGSLGLLLGFYGFARWESSDVDDLEGDLKAGDLGVGWHLGLGDTVHGLVEVAYTDREIGPLDSDGYTVSVGVRFAPVERWEFGVKAGYRDLDRNLDGGYGEGYALWKVWSVVGLTARAELAEDANRFGIGARISF